MLRSTIIIIAFHFETHVYTQYASFFRFLLKNHHLPTPTCLSTCYDLHLLRSRTSFRWFVLREDTKNVHHRYSSARSSPLSRFFEVVASMPTDSSRVSTKSKETPGRIFHPGITVASDTDVAERGFARRSIHDERKDAIVTSSERIFYSRSNLCAVHRAPCTRESRAGMLRARRKKRIFHASGTPIYARPFLDALKRLKLSIEWTSGSAVLTSLPVSSHRYEWEIVIDTGGRTIYRGKRRSLEKKVRTIIEKDGGR